MKPHKEEHAQVKELLMILQTEKQIANVRFTICFDAVSGTRTHTVTHWHLKPARLPIPPWPQIRRITAADWYLSYNMIQTAVNPFVREIFTVQSLFEAWL